jgi:hypothetical protein
MINYSIGITTYSYRFEKFLINLVKEIRRDKNNEIILAINGNYKQPFDEKYRKNVLNFCGEYENIYPFMFPNFRSLAKMWNNIAINATNNYIVMLNDDISIFDPVFWKSVEDNIEKYQTSFKMDHTFCYFVVKRDELNQLGWFDERYLGIGWEDTDFIDRYEKAYHRKFLDILGVPGAKRFTDFENVIVNQRVIYKYSVFNNEIYDKKLPFVPQYPHEKFFWENKEKL